MGVFQKEQKIDKIKKQKKDVGAAGRKLIKKFVIISI